MPEPKHTRITWLIKSKELWNINNSHLPAYGLAKASKGGAEMKEINKYCGECFEYHKMDCGGVYKDGEPNCYRFPKRPSWNKFFMNVAVQLTSRSTCHRQQVGAVLVVGKRILATGYNGSPPGDLHCLDIGCLREKMGIPSGQRHEVCRAIHAEQNLILQLAQHGVAGVENAKVYTTLFPCYICAKLLVGIGVKEIHYIKGYPDELSRELLDRMGVKLYETVL